MKTRVESRSGPDSGVASGMCLFLSFIAFSSPLVLRADGGAVLLRQSQGPFTVTVYTPAEVMADSSSDLTVLVQNRETAGVILDADVILQLAPPPNSIIDPRREYCGLENNVSVAEGSSIATGPYLVHTVLGSVAARFLYAASVAFPKAGNWSLEVLVSRNGQTTDIPSSLVVKTPGSRIASIGPYLSVPPVMIALFLVNLWLREYRVVRHPNGTSIVLEQR
jgi:hypothetical protein